MSYEGYKVLITTTRYGQAGVAIHTVVASYPNRGDADAAFNAVNNQKPAPTEYTQRAVRLY